MFLPHFDVFCDLLLNRCLAKWNLFVYIITKWITTHKAFVYFKILQHNTKAAFAPPLPTLAKTKKPFDVIYDLYKMKQFYWLLLHRKELWLVKKSHAIVKPDLQRKQNWTAKSTNLEKMLEKSCQFLSSEQPCGRKSFDVALKIAGVEKVPSENLWLRST